MRKLSYLLLPVIAVVLFTALSAAAQTRGELLAAQAAERQAMAAYQAKDFAGFLAGMSEANRLRPNHPRLIYNLADAYALNGKGKEAADQLVHLAGMGLYFEPEKDEDFKSIRERPLFKFAVDQFARNRQPVDRTVRAFSLPDKEMITESVAYDPAGGRFFVSSVHQRKIVVRDKNGKVQDFSSLSDGLYAVLGMKIDAKRGLLWACSTAVPQMKGYAESDKGRAGVFKYDLKTGRLLDKYLLPADDGEHVLGEHVLGDLAIAKNGDVYATDSAQPVIYKIAAGAAGKPEVFLKSDAFASLQGITFSPDEKYMFVADYSLGFFRVDMKDKGVLQLANTFGAALLGTDGLYFHNGGLIAAQNGIAPQRIAKFTLNAALTGVTAQQVLAANLADFNEPTLGVLDGDDFYFIANSQWGLVSDKGALEKDKLREPVILKIDMAK